MFTVVIPVFNNYAQAVEAINSCDIDMVEQIIVVDDSGLIGYEWSSYISEPLINKITFLCNIKNRGVTFSRNRGYFLAKSKYVIFLDSDDLLLGSEALKACSFIDDSKSDVVLFNTETKRKANSFSYEFFGRDIDLVRLANKGERLVVVRKLTAGKPFYGALRGHELSGIYRFVSDNKLKVGWCPLALREYCSNNPGSLSSFRKSPERSTYIAYGHYTLAKKLLKNREYYYFSLYMLKAIWYKKNAMLSIRPD